MNRGLKLFKIGRESIKEHFLNGNSKKVQLKIAGNSEEKVYLVGKLEKCVSRNNIGYVNYLRINHPGEHWHGFVMQKMEDKQGLLFRFVGTFQFLGVIIRFSRNSDQKCLRTSIPSSWSKRAKFYTTLLNHRMQREEQF